MIEITNFSIKNLFGYMNVTIPITDNKIVLSGINGTGKTTILTMLFYIMTGDWIKLSSFDFEKISITINNKKEEITYKALEENFFKRSKKLKKFKEEFFSDNQVKDIYALILEKSLQKDEIKNLITDNFLSLVENPKDIPKDVIAEQIINIRNEFYYLSKENNYGNDIIKSFIDIKKLFLPTYRRIEKDFSYLFGTLSPYYFQKKIKTLNSTLEVINFGMADVENKINNTLEKIQKIKFNIRVSKFFETRNTLDSEGLEIITALKKELESEDGIDYSEKLQILEKPMLDFVAVCNKYLSASDKIVQYNDQDYTFKILSKNTHEVALKALSSGEKKILSIFSDLYLGDYDNFAFIIDEPELSLSVEWQKTFLPDILATGKCRFLMAVTHSPFIFENELDPYTQDMQALCPH